MNLEKLRQNWDGLGAEDPCWAILSHREKRGNGWDLEEFFATGRTLILETMQWLGRSRVQIGTERALDFGCGAGRLTYAMAEHFDRVTGVDIAPSMIRNAEEMKYRAPTCDFLLNDKSDLTVFADETFDFVCSYIVLQHMEPRYAEAYVREFARVLKPGGAAVFQVPSEPIATIKGQLRRVFATRTLQPILNAYKRVRFCHTGAMEMYGIRKERVLELAQECGLRMKRVAPCASAGPTWMSFRYLAVKEPDRCASSR